MEKKKSKKYLWLLLLLLFIIIFGIILLKTGLVSGLLGFGRYQDPNSKYIDFEKRDYDPPLDLFDDIRSLLGIEIHDINLECYMEVDYNFSVCADICEEPLLICHNACDNESGYNGCINMCDGLDYGGELEADEAHAMAYLDFPDYYECYDYCTDNFFDYECHNSCELEYTEYEDCVYECDYTADTAFMTHCFTNINETYVWDGRAIYDISSFFEDNYPSATLNYMNKCTDFIHDGIWTHESDFIGCTYFWGFDFWGEGTTCSDESLMSVKSVCETIGWHWNCGETEISCTR